MKEKEIKSRWIVEKGRWDPEVRNFVDRHKEEFTRTIKMRINGDILEFIGGPTGHERYYIKDMLSRNSNEFPEICICAGTINRWPACYVPRQDIKDFLDTEICTSINDKDLGEEK